VSDGQILALVGGAGALAGALVTGVVSLVAAALTRRHERQRWLLDKLLEAYVDFNASAFAWLRAYMQAGLVTDPLNDDYMKLGNATRRVQLLAPARTADKTLDVFGVVAEVMRFFEAPGTATVTDHQAELDNITSGLAALGRLQKDDLRGKERRRLP